MTTKCTSLSQPEQVAFLEKLLLTIPQTECPVFHHFGPGLYIREVHIPKGTLAIGHTQKLAHLNIVLQGSVLIFGDDHSNLVEAPLIFTGPPGRKFGYVVEDVIWQNIYATNETDVEILEKTYLDKSLSYQEHEACVTTIYSALRSDDRADFKKFLAEVNITDAKVRKMSEDDTDQIPMPTGYPTITIRNSYIEGKGVFLSSGVRAGELIGPARLGPMRTPLGRYTNHAQHSNAEFKVLNPAVESTEDHVVADSIYLYATQDIGGCLAGGKGTEVTVNYRASLALPNFRGEKK